MVEADRIIDPSLLLEPNITIQMSSLGLESSNSPLDSGLHRQQATLVLLQPLANADLLEACRVPNPPQDRKLNLLEYPDLRNEYLDIQPLSQAWRRALKRVPPIPRLTFDLTLPKKGESKDSFRGLSWDTAMPLEEGIGVKTRDVMTLVITIATRVSMRADGDVWFEVVYDETEGVSPKAIKILRNNLLALADPKPGGTEDEQLGEDDGE